MTGILASLHLDQTQLADRINVELTVEGGPDGRWHGTFKLAPDVPLSLGASCTLVLADGRRGRIQVTRLAYGGRKDDIRVHFRGEGKLAG
jgi:hypothetical protein